jgi:TPR repeat protein
VERDEVKSAEWFRKAAEQGEADAQYFYGLRCASGRGVTKNEAEAVMWLRRLGVRE